MSYHHPSDGLTILSPDDLGLMPGWESGVLVCETQYKDNVLDLHAVKVSPE